MPLPCVFVMQSAQNRPSHHVLIPCDLVSARSDRLPADPSIGDAWPQAGMRSPLIVVLDPFLEDSPQMFLAQRDQEIQALSANRADEPLAVCIRLRRPEGSLQYLEAHRLQARIQIR